ncbi:MAG: hypothetical protein Q7V31_16700 [Parvibaculum sp.]|uniref:hypothetical protein n=1 Tax=Parvibaculum sp. TaxID=2024848 RepID=UPI00271968A6|nr:hypothetical protein [Parvibaculum sp.]MDO8840556.1 hypothetical protein [Parvibaculum sp.]
MTLGELQEFLAGRNIDPAAVRYGSGSDADTEEFRIEHSGSMWEVYYAERGRKNELRRFPDEESACRYLLSLLESDRSVWKK